MSELNGNHPEQSQKEMGELSNHHSDRTQPVPIPEKPQYDVKIVEQFVLKYAGFWTRFWAYLIDMIVLWSIGRLLVYPIFRLAGWEIATDVWYAPITIITAVIFYLYFVLMTKFFGQTVGKMILGIKVVSLNGKSLSWSTVLFREWVGRIISSAFLILYFLYFLVAFTPKKQGVHDFIADTTVVHESSYMKQMKKIFKKRESLSELQEPNAF
ncbi:RDD family protein [Chungangia koreensis]|uniref:RDD family protein n=1 Tax=Chungangia koreensis TaxID=752657 RepID=A0ABV8X3Q3_9LACT